MILRYALRRALWIPPTLVGITLVLFAVLTAVQQTSAVKRGDIDPAVLRLQSLPLLINIQPTDVRSRTRELVAIIAHDPNAVTARKDLARMGGAALPFVLPHLDALEPEERGRVALALEPIARRMGLGEPRAFAAPTSAVRFWTGFWDEREIDFRTSVARRAVRRYSMHGSDARKADLFELDTFALPEIIAALGEIRTADDVARASRLIAVASHVSARDDLMAPNTSVDEARRCAARWRKWWRRNRFEYEALGGTARVTAMILHTRYGQWAIHAMAAGFGTTSDGTPLLGKLLASLPRTFAFAGISLLLAHTAAIPINLLLARTRQAPIHRISALVTLMLLALPPPVLILSASWLTANRYFAPTALLAAALGLLGAPAQHRLAAARAARAAHLTMSRAKGLSENRIMLVHVGKETLFLSLTGLASGFPLALSIACVVEHAFSLPGACSELKRAISENDTQFLMAFGVVGSACTSLLLFSADLVGAWLDPRLALELMERRRL